MGNLYKNTLHSKKKLLIHYLLSSVKGFLFLVITLLSINTGVLAQCDCTNGTGSDASPGRIADLIGTAPTIDGTIEANWSNAPTNNINQTISGTIQTTSTWQAMYDKTNLYVLVKVIDANKSIVGTNVWDQDGIEIFIDANNTKSACCSSYPQTYQHQSRFLYRATDGASVSITGGQAITTGSNWVYSTAGGYNLEVSIPWSSIGGNAPLPGNKIGFDVDINDQQNGADAREATAGYYLTSGDDWQDASKFGTARLSGCMGAYGGTSWTAETEISAGRFDYGGGEVSLCSWDEVGNGGNTGLNVRTDFTATAATPYIETVDIDGNVGWSGTAEYLQYTINASSAGNYYIDASVATPNASQNFAVYIDGVQVGANINVTNTGGWQTYTTKTSSTTVALNGTHKLRFTWVDGGLNFNWIKFRAASTTYYGCDGADLSSVANWETVNNCTGSNPANFTTAGDIFIVEAGETGTFSANTVFTGTTLTVNGTITPASGVVISGTGTLNGTGTVKVTGTASMSTQYTLSTLTLTGNTVDYAGSGAQSVSALTYNNLTITNTAAITTAGSIVVNGTLTVAASATLFMDGAAETLTGTLGTISNSGTIKTASTTNPPFAASKTWNGLVEFSVLAGGQSIPAGTYTNITLDNTSGTNTAVGNLSVSGTVTTKAGGTFALGTNTLGSCTMAIENGSIISGSGAITLGGNLTVTNTGNANSSTIANPIALGADRTISVADGTHASDLILNGAITGAYRLTKTGAGNLSLVSTSNTYSGGTTITAGTLTLGAAGVLADNASMILNGGTLNTGGFTESLGTGTLTLSANSTITLTAAVHTLTFGNSSAVAWTGGTTLTISGWTGSAGATGTNGKIFFSNAAGTLTAAQLAQISFTGFSGPATLLSTGELVPTIAYYSASATNLQTLGNWTTNPDGVTITGSPANFTSTGCTYIIRSAAGTTIGANWVVSGTGSKVVVGNGTTTSNFTIPSGFSFTGSIDVAASSTLTLSNATVPTIGALNATSTVNYAVAAGGQTIGAATYGHLTMSNTSGTNTAAGAIAVEGTLTTTAGGTMDMSTYALSGTMGTVSSSGTIKTANSGTPIPTGKTWGGTVEYNRAGAQTISNGTYSNLTISGSGTKTLANTTTVSAALTVKAGNTLALSTYALGSPTSVNIEIGSAATAITGTGAGVLTLGGNISVTDDGGNGNGATISCSVALNGNRTITVADDAVAADLTISGVITGANTLEKLGAGTLVLSGNNTFSSGTTLSAGTININHAAGLGSGTFTIANGTTIDNTSGAAITATNAMTWNGNFSYSGTNNLTLSGAASAASRTITTNGASTLTLSGVLSGGAVSLAKAGTGIMTLSGNNTFSGGTTLSAGTLNINHAAALGTGTFTIADGTTIDNTSGGSVTATNAMTWNGNFTYSGTNDLILSGNAATASRTITNNGASTLTLSGILSGASTFTKAGTGIMIVSGSNTYTGLTTISAGTLKLGGAGAGTDSPLGTTGAGTTVSSGAVLDLNGYTLATAEALTINGTGLTASPAGVLTNTGANASYSGALTLGSASTITATSSGTLTVSGAIGGAGQNLILNGTAGTGTISGVIGTTTGTLTKSGAGTWVLSGVNTYTGTTTISAGTLRLGGAGRIADASNMSVGGGTFSTGSGAGNAETIGTLSMSASSTIALGTGAHSINYSASNAATWTGTLTITGWTGTAGVTGTAGKIYFGSGTGTLTSTQLGQISFTGFTPADATLLGTGEIVPRAAVSICEGICTVTLTGASGDYAAATNSRICIAGTSGSPYTGQITNIANVSGVWICVTGNWTPSNVNATNFSASANLAKFDITGTLVTNGHISLWNTAMTNSGSISITGAGNYMKMDGNNDWSTLVNNGTISIASGDLIGPKGASGSIDNYGTITLSGSSYRVNLDNFGAASFINRAAGVITTNGDFRMLSAGGTSNLYNYGIINTTGATGAATGNFYSDNETATASAFYNYGKIKTYNFQMNTSDLDFYNYCYINVLNNYQQSRGGDATAGMNGPTTASGYVGKISVANTSTYTSGVFVPSGQEMDFCDAGSPVGGWDATDPAAGGWTACTRGADGDATCDAIVLPIKLVSFSVSCSKMDDSRIAFEWATVSETNNDYFTVLESKDGKSFHEVKNVKGAGTSNEKLVYNTEVAIESESLPMYYRLKQTDYDGATAYSDIVTFEGCKKNFQVKVLNNGNSEDKNIMIYINSDDNLVLSISLFDITGRLVEDKKNIIASNNFIEFANVSSGMYLLQITSAYNNYVEKVVVR